MSKTTATAYAVAMKTWHSPCGGDVAIYWKALGLGSAVGAAYPRGCRILLDTRWATRTRRDNPALYCTVILHEMGHIAGYRPPERYADPDDIYHSTSEASVMHNITYGTDPRCARAFD
ncbi:MAG: hypothetical protein M3R46_06700 [Actinomycetota bacterium]|nr:hypothetical protein [Actinomycetota bacterium]